MLKLGKFRQWLHDTFESRQQKRQKPRQGQRVLPRLEALEAREVPATFVANSIGELQAKIAQANGTAAADIINVKAGAIFDLSDDAALFISATGGGLTIRSLGANTTIERDGFEEFDRIFVVEEGAKLSLSKLTIQDGYANADSDFGAQGGGILSFGTLSIANCIIRGNLADGDGGEGSDSAIGGGIASYGQLTITTSTITGNLAEADDDDFGSCTAPYALGGGVAHFEGKLTITNTEFSDNKAIGGFSGSEGGEGQGGYAAGGGLYAGAEANLIPSITITNSLFDDNQAIGGDAFAGGEGDARGGDAFGGGAALGGPLSSKYGDASASTASISISNTIFQENLAEGGAANGENFGGSKFEGGNASGGGLFFTGESTVVLSKNQFLANEAVGGEASFSGSEGGAVAGIGGSAFGGGVAAGTEFGLETGCCGDEEDLHYYGSLTITSNIFDENVAEGGFAQGAEGAAGGSGLGGGLGYSGGGLTQITSSTFTENQALGGQAEQEGANFIGAAVFGGTALGGGIFYNTPENCDYGKGDDAPPNILNIKNSLLQDNEAFGGKAEIDINDSDIILLGLGGQANGGGLFLGGESSVTISGTTKFDDNHAKGGQADVAVEFSGGEGEFEVALGGSGSGGAISAGGGFAFSGPIPDSEFDSFDFYGSLTITTGTFTDNIAEGGEALLEIEDFDGFDEDQFAAGGQGAGGALFIRGFGLNGGASTTTTVTGSTFSGNQALGGAATIDGLGDASGGAGIGGAIAHGAEEEFFIPGLPAFSDNGDSYYGNSTLTITTTTISTNTAQGGLAAVASENFSFDEATGGDGIGGGLYTDPNVQTTISRSTFDNNDALGGNADNYGDADLLFGGNGLGGGLALGTNDSCGRGGSWSGSEGADPYQLTVTNCTFTLNEAAGGDAEGGDEKSHGGDGLGGGLFIEEGSYVRIVNTTIARNDATAGEAEDGCDGEGLGGGLYSGDECEGPEPLTFVEGGGCGSEIEILNALIALNTADDDGQDVYGAVFSLGHNLIFDSWGSCGFNEDDFLDQFTEAQLKLGQLAFNGGPTKTLALLAGSAAINKGSNSVLNSTPGSFDKLIVDQRGHLRKAGPFVDIGAYEFGSAFLGRGQP
jgi:hypothetical protein